MDNGYPLINDKNIVACILQNDKEKIMNYRNFTEQIKKEVVVRLGDDFSVQLYQETKNNGKKRTGLLIETEERNIHPIIYLEE